MYEAIQKLETTQNPVGKVPLVVCGHEGQLIIEELFNEKAGTGAGEVAPVHDGNNSLSLSLLSLLKYSAIGGGVGICLRCRRSLPN